jgi:F420-non-reducing hydrogenase iron-sulfur subunit
MIEPRSAVTRGNVSIRPLPSATVFVCANCSRPGRVPTSGGRPPPDVPDFAWPASFRQVLLPCTGRLQPEHVLKAFESGADVVCAIGCQEDNCHHLEGSRRCARRVDHVRALLQEIGLGGERLLFFVLPGTAGEDTALGAGAAAPGRPSSIAADLAAAVRDLVVAAVEGLPPSPLRPVPAAEPASSPSGIGSQR